MQIHIQNQTAYTLTLGEEHHVPESFLSGKHCGPSGTPEILARCGCPLTLQAAVVCNSCLPSLLAPAFADARGSSYISEGAAGVRPPCGF
eukprot:s5168_g9.t1